MPPPREPAAAEIPPSPELLSQLQTVLQDLSQNPYPYVENPPNCKKRASVALIIRIQPRYSHWPDKQHAAQWADKTANESVESRLDSFFAQDWVQHGDPEVLFIKRAHRPGDRWTSHVALPGGRRDPEDADDRAAAVRETEEEVGIELTDANSIPVGNLPERIVTTSWGKVPLMVLCPYIYLLTDPSPPALRLQPAEVGSTHWVSIRALLSPSQRTYWHEDVSNRLAKQEFGIKRWFLRVMLGKMIFAAIRLIPSHSEYCSTIPAFVPDDDDDSSSGRSAAAQLANWWHGRGVQPSASTDTPLLLWGLTLGILADFLDLIPPCNAVRLWTYPTFTPPDVRLLLWAASYAFRKRKARVLAEHHNGVRGVPVVVEEGLDSVEPDGSIEPPESGISGLGAERYYSRLGQKNPATRSSSVGILLEGYYDIVRKTVALSLAARVSVFAAVVATVIVKYRRLR
ncbi:nudix family hydrolase [Diplodia corticola]|uniref:Nudix family hydrolase n=1 Tax=Diplodia corticola TaxID=236234 RepID=A0A1J9RG62_9PEZI|nr:nudix family hydrolase [Diplodia corticola]OJD31531.1 nudix family hydrolase [Diplodia corticola]